MPTVATAPQRIGFFGPFGTFTEQALLTQADLAAAELVPYRTVPDVLDAVASGAVDVGFVPIENLVGRAEILFFSVDGTHPWYEIWWWPFDIRWSRLLQRIR